MAIPTDIIDEIRSRAEIIGVVGDYVSLKKRGRNWLGLCPFHGEKTPSFTVSADKGMFYCFGCGVGGNVFTFIMRIENLGFEEAVRSMASRVGVTIPERPVTHADKEQKQKKEQISAAIEEAALFYHNILLKQPEGEEGRSYLKVRGYDIEIARAFKLGWAPRTWDALIEHLKSKEFSLAEAQDAGLAIRREGGGYYDRFRGRVMFPICSVQGKTLGFGGRVIKSDEEPKYLNSPETIVYKKSEVLYGLNAAKNAIRDRDSAIIVEGYFDCMALHKHGFANAVATCGTALTIQHVRILTRYTANLYPLFDADEAGEKAAGRALEVIIAAPAKAFYVALPSGDPDSFLAEKGPEELKSLFKDAPSLLQATVDEMVSKAGLSIESRQEALKETAALLSKMADRQAMEMYIRETATRLLPGAGAGAEQLLREEIARVKNATSRVMQPKEAGAKKASAPPPSPEMYLVALCMDSPEALAKLKEAPEVIEDFEDASMMEATKALMTISNSSSLFDSMSPGVADALTRVTMETAGNEDRKPEEEFEALVLRIRLKKIARLKNEIQAKLVLAGPDEQVALLRRKSELVEMERALAEGPRVSPDDAQHSPTR